MGNRLSKIYTRTGDRGETGLADGRRVPKDHPRVEAIGELDSLNSQLGLRRVRHRMFAQKAAHKPADLAPSGAVQPLTQRDELLFFLFLHPQHELAALFLLILKLCC